MISQRIRESRRVRALKLPKNIDRLYREGKCRDCTVVVTRMDFAKILGKFTKVKIQYESSSSPKTKKNAQATSPITNARLKSNENGMVLIHRNAYKEHPVKELLSTKKAKATATPPVTPKQSNNVLKENNRLKKTPIVKDKNSNISISSSNQTKKKNNLQLKQYGIIFIDPVTKSKREPRNKQTLQDLLPLIDKGILPNEDWAIDYLPKNEEPKNDKVYDRIAAELEDLMYNDKPAVKSEEKPEPTETKVDDFPSIMDILNDSNNSDDQKPVDQNTTTLESSDVEAMLLGKTDSAKELVSTPMEVDNTDMSNLIEDVAQLNAIQVTASEQENATKILPIEEDLDNPHSPSILDEALQKGIEEHLPCDAPLATETSDQSKSTTDEVPVNGIDSHTTSNKLDELVDQKLSLPNNISHLIFQKNVNGECVKCVTCPKNLKYSIELNGKSVVFLGAPLSISSIEDLQVLLQIVNETDLESPYVCQ